MLSERKERRGEPDGAAAGLTAFRMLREYRRLHELSSTEESTVGDKRQPLRLQLRDQLANSVAEMAAAVSGGGQQAVNSPYLQHHKL